MTTIAPVLPLGIKIRKHPPLPSSFTLTSGLRFLEHTFSHPEWRKILNQQGGRPSLFCLVSSPSSLRSQAISAARLSCSAPGRVDAFLPLSSLFLSAYGRLVEAFLLFSPLFWALKRCRCRSRGIRFSLSPPSDYCGLSPFFFAIGDQRARL